MWANCTGYQNALDAAKPLALRQEMRRVHVHLFVRVPTVAGRRVGHQWIRITALLVCNPQRVDRIRGS
jgi:hypothetical protein